MKTPHVVILTLILALACAAPVAPEEEPTPPAPEEEPAPADSPDLEGPVPWEELPILGVDEALAACTGLHPGGELKGSSGSMPYESLAGTWSRSGSRLELDLRTTLHMYDSDMQVQAQPEVRHQVVLPISWAWQDWHQVVHLAGHGSMDGVDGPVQVICEDHWVTTWDTPYLVVLDAGAGPEAVKVAGRAAATVDRTVLFGGGAQTPRPQGTVEVLYAPGHEEKAQELAERLGRSWTTAVAKPWEQAPAPVVVAAGPRL